MKRKHVAFGLNFLLPGLGFAYLRQWKWAAVNFGVTLALIILIMSVSPAFWEAFSSSFALLSGFVSGVWAMRTAEALARRPREATSLEAIAEEAQLR